MQCIFQAQTMGVMAALIVDICWGPTLLLAMETGSRIFSVLLESCCCCSWRPKGLRATAVVDTIIKKKCENMDYLNILLYEINMCSLGHFKRQQANGKRLLCITGQASQALSMVNKVNTHTLFCLQERGEFHKECSRALHCLQMMWHSVKWTSQNVNN